MHEPAEQIFERYLRSLGVDIDADPELAGTAARFTTLMRERFAAAPEPVPIRAIEAPASPGVAQVIVVSRIPVRAMCAHHLMPFVGTVSVAYLPERHIVGFGALHRLVDGLSLGPQLQERLTHALVHALHGALAPRWTAVRIRARQTCAEMTFGGRRTVATTLATRGDVTPAEAWTFVSGRPTAGHAANHDP
jgi:GTP cyclohydrolase I